MSDSPPLLDPDKLRLKRIRARMSRPALARRAGLHPSHVAFLERGKRGTTPETLGLLADVLGCDITELMPDEPDGAKAA
jgi:transcriptional regulator with XRE-family HTH domain